MCQSLAPDCVRAITHSPLPQVEEHVQASPDVVHCRRRRASSVLLCTPDNEQQDTAGRKCTYADLQAALLKYAALLHVVQNVRRGACCVGADGERREVERRLGLLTWDERSVYEDLGEG